MSQGCSGRWRMRRFTSGHGDAVFLSSSMVLRRSRTVSSTASVTGVSAFSVSVVFMAYPILQF